MFLHIFTLEKQGAGRSPYADQNPLTAAHYQYTTHRAIFPAKNWGLPIVFPKYNPAFAENPRQ